MKACHSWLLTASYLYSFVAGSTQLEKRASIEDCLTSSEVPIYSSNSSTYTQAIKPFNLRVPFTPAAYAVPETVKHVQDAVSCGVKNKVRVTAKSGGHSYGSHGLGGEDGHLVVDMRKFNSVTVDEDAHTAVVGSGGRLGNIALALYEQGKQATSHGTCPGVGIGGLLLHGGYGLISRLKGLTLDNILEATVVLADSTVVKASATENPDLFWALRGAGAAMGIVTHFKLKTFTAPESNLVFSYNLSPPNATALARTLTILQNFTINSQPPELNMRWFLQRELTGVFYGPRSQYDAIMTPLLTALNIPTNTTGRGAGSVKEKDWIDTLTSFSNGPLQQPDLYDYHENFYAKSLMPSYLSDAAITAMSEYYFDTARSVRRPWYLLIDMHGGAGSAVSAVGADDTAYSHRNATFKMQFYDIQFGGSKWDPEWFDFMGGWVQGIIDATPGVDLGMYINYADTELSKEEAHRYYWGAHYERLVSVKGKYDPDKVFEGPQLVGS